ncbi:Hydantoinase B/oxoprolinase-domain-containing protein [Aspergillus pseudocaelatus]|uniref:Hydantoinase B/oxoprolinase-domain-containing protein n=1 Tax=Aspergillus pseudocaelatus TaxID=1825620 RepID=A0ABQ6WVY8_9EURO|nr:Hydantoinase B/oxoprolinase-domain-containing protein [Aspergillus pseudocaelatus]
MPKSTGTKPLRISIDRGGTFTDCVCKVVNGDDIIAKILSVDPKNYADAPTEAIRRVLEKYYNCTIPRGTELDLRDVEWIRMGTTVATNALLERKGERTALLITEGFKDVLQIGNQSRPQMFDLTIRRPMPLYAEAFEVKERVIVQACSDSDLRSIHLSSPEPVESVMGPSGEIVQVLQPLNMVSTRLNLQKIYGQGFRSLAVCLMHSYSFPKHELQMRDIALEIGFENVSLSHETSSRPKLVPRGNSTVVDAYLTPNIKRYLQRFSEGFPDIENSQTRLEFMQSDGGLVPSSSLSGLHSILSGPAGGVIGYARTCFDTETRTPVIGFDMGGTSTDVSRYDGKLDHIFETTTAGITIHAPQLNVNTIAAGGGSILTWRDGLMSVGPESASSNPGPACYRKGGPLTVTDANLALGRLIPEEFPSVFGVNEDEPLDRDIVLAKFKDLTQVINQETGKSLTWAEVADGFLQVANSAMCGPIRSLTLEKGHDVAKHHLASFGGAGGQHACAIASDLGIKRVLIHKYSSILSAYGIGLADVVHEEERVCAKAFDESTIDIINDSLDSLVDCARSSKTMAPFSNIQACRFLSMRYDGSETSIMIPWDSPESDAKEAFVNAHHQQFGFTPVNRVVYVDTIRIRAIGCSVFHDSSSSPRVKSLMIPKSTTTTATPNSKVSTYFTAAGWVGTPVYHLNLLSEGCQIQGPAMIIDKTQTIVVGPNSKATVAQDVLLLDIDSPSSKSTGSESIDPVQLSIFRHRFMGVAEQMGRVLQNVSTSANIKERLDFTCAIFTPEGDLVANAPHVPAMIGSMAFAVRSQIAEWHGRLQDGDVLLSNTPAYGGVHLPDLTVITPVFDSAGKDIVFWVASRGHHADVGGILPGSMPPMSKLLSEEGAIFNSHLLVRGGHFDEEELRHILCVEPARFPGSSGSRRFQDNVTDLKAQVAANHCGARLMRRLIEEYSFRVVQVYMGAIQDSAELAVRNLLKRLAHERSGEDISAVDYMDDGTPIKLKVTINPTDGSAIFDFTGTGPEVYGNRNAPIAICNSAVIFTLRCMVNSDIPLNHGCIKPVQIIIPEGSLLRPSSEAAVCAGNVLTSQRIVDVIFKSFKVCAASQGCMNNLTFGNDGENGFGYYETIAGGSGAGPSWAGTGGVHTNMTNTRITDPESLERRYPVILRRFSLRSGSGGAGLYPGGDGVVRDIELRLPMSVSILSERRSFAPYGMAGGEDGQRGKNTWITKAGRCINVGGKSSIRVQPGDRFVIETPGGGGYGPPGEVARREKNQSIVMLPFIPVANGSVAANRILAEQV